jgi:hypothetical protein
MREVYANLDAVENHRSCAEGKSCGERVARLGESQAESDQKESWERKNRG